MNPSTQEEQSLSARSYALQKIRGRGGVARRPWLRLHAGLVAAAVAVLFILGTAAAQLAQAQVESMLYSFTGSNDGGAPLAGLIMDSSGNLYGTTSDGGPGGWGTVFGIAPITLSATSFDFGNVAIGTTTGAQTVTITNIGSGNFSYNTASISGTGAADFSVTNGCSTAVAPNGTCSVSVTFTPSTTGSKTATLNLSQGGMTQTVSLTGAGAYPTADLSASTLTFSSQPVGATSSSQTLTVSNTSVVPLTVTSVGITDDFAIASNNCTGSVGAGNTCTVGVTFTPTAAGTRSGTLSFTDNTATGLQNVALTGTGAITTVSVSPTTLSFGQQMAGTKSADQMVTVTNTGSSTNLAFSAISASSNFVIDPAQTSCTTSTPVAPGGSCQVAVAFAPTTGGTLPGTLTLTGDMSPVTVTVPLGGKGEALSVSPSSLTFGSTVVGTTSSAQTVTVTNTGTSSVTFSGFTAMGDFAVNAGSTTCSTSTALGAGSSCTVGVTFAPTATGTLTGSLAIASDAGSGSVALSGTGTAPGVTLSPSSLTFRGTVVGSTSSAQSVTLTNSGTSSLTISGIAPSGEFAISAARTTCSTSTALAASSSCTIAVTFTPDGAGTRTGAVTITDNAGSSPQTVALSGTGTAPGVTLSPSSLTFSGTVVGSTSSAQSVTLTNSGTSSLTISGIAPSGEFAISAAGTTCSTSTALAASGSCTIAVTFTPDGAGTNTGTITISDNAGSSPQTVALSGEGADFTLGMASGSSSSASVSAGGSASYTLALAPEGGFNQAVNLACSGAPAYATRTVSPASVTLNGTSNSSVSVKVSTTAASMVAPGPGNFDPPPPSGPLPVAAWLALFGLLALIVLAKFSPKGGRVRRAAPWATLALAAALFAGCGGGSSTTTTTTSNSTPTGTYTLTVTAKSGGLTQTSQVTLKVQ